MNALRALLPALKNKIYFNYGGQGPLPSPSLQAITTSWGKIQELGPFTNDLWPYLMNEMATTRQVLSALCGVTQKRLALTENVTTGCVLPLWGLPFSSEDRLLISDCEHPGVVAACSELARRQHLGIDILPIMHLREGLEKQEESDRAVLDLLERNLTKKTRLVVLSHLLWNTGQLMPIAKVAACLKAHQNRPFLLVDAAQSFGQLDVQRAAPYADIYAFTGHKWALGPEGLGGVVLSERVLNESSPTLIGWRSLKHESIFSGQEILPTPFHEDSRRFEIATSCIPLLAGLRRSLELLAQEGSTNERASKICSLSSQLWANIQSIDGIQSILKGPPPAGLVSFKIKSQETPKRHVKLLGKDHLWIRDIENPACLRACVHIISNQDDIFTLCTALKKLAKN